MDIRYAIYFIPPARSKFYQAGSRILGYDIRSQKIGSTARHDGPPLLLHFGSAHYFGFHATIRGTFKTEDISSLQEELSTIVKGSAPITIKNSFLHSLSERDRSVLFNPDSESARDLFHLHARIVGMVDKYRMTGYVSPETQAIAQMLGERELELLQAHGDPRVMEGYLFHFTLANKASTKQLAILDKYIKEEEENLCHQTVQIDRLCLVGQNERDLYWKILEEYVFDGADPS